MYSDDFVRGNFWKFSQLGDTYKLPLIHTACLYQTSLCQFTHSQQDSRGVLFPDNLAKHRYYYLTGNNLIGQKSISLFNLHFRLIRQNSFFLQPCIVFTYVTTLNKLLSTWNKSSALGTISLGRRFSEAWSIFINATDSRIFNIF